MELEAARAARTSGAAAAQSVRVALQALLKEVRRAQLYGGVKMITPDSRFSSMYLAAMHQALADLPVVVLGVSPDAILVGETEVLGGGDRGSVPDRLYAEGTRGISIEREVSDEELVALARLLVTAWGDGMEESLTDAVWLADFRHVAFEMVERVGEIGGDTLTGDSPLVRSLMGLVDEINRQNPEEISRIRQDEFALLRRLHEELGGDGGADNRVAAALSLPVNLRSEVESARAGTDLDGVDRLGVLASFAAASRDDAVVIAMLYLVFEALEAVEPDDGAAARLRATLDGALGGNPHLAERFADWATLNIEVRRRFVALVERRGEALAGPLFSLFGMLRGDGARNALVADLPNWALRVLVDAWLSEEPPREPAHTVRTLLAMKDREPVRIALALARRVDHPPLVDPILQVLEHEDAGLREDALFAVRRYQTPRLREAVHRLLDDPEAAVRLEALRYAVAYRDTDLAGRIEARLLAVTPTQAQDGEVRALGIALGRLLRERGEAHLISIALGAKPSAHPFAPCAALHGLRAIGSATARSAMARIGADVPGLSDLARELLGGTR